MLEKINDRVERLILKIVGPVFFIYIVVIFAQVIARNYIQIPVIWLDEVARMSFQWTLMLGAAVAVRRQAHYVVEIVPQRHFWAAVGLKIFAEGVMAVFVVVMVVHGSSFARMGLGRLSSALELPWIYIYVSMPVSGVFMMLFLAEILIGDVRQVRSRIRGE